MGALTSSEPRIIASSYRAGREPFVVAVGVVDGAASPPGSVAVFD